MKRGLSNDQKEQVDCGLYDTDYLERVEQQALSQEDKPGTHLTQREIARATGISQPTVSRILKNDLHLRCFKNHRATELTEANKVARLHRAHQLLAKYPASLVNFIVFTDEKIFGGPPNQ